MHSIATHYSARVTNVGRHALQGVGLIVALSVATFSGHLILAHLSGQKARNEAIDERVFQAFHSIRRQCLSEEFPLETVRCVGALDYLFGCDRTDAGCTADEVYCLLYELGFDLPPYYRSDSPFADQSPC